MTAPFRYTPFAIVWTATVVSNVGGWMYTTAAGWLMTNLSTDPLLVSLVQVANSLPMLLFALVAGALSDIVDKRKFLIAGEIGTAVLSAVFAAMVWFGYVNPTSLLWFVFLIGAAGALTSPAWQSVVPELVPKKALAAAVAANSAGVNVSRAIGPAVAGAITGPFGIASPFVVNAVSNFGVIAALFWWREPKRTPSALPAEQFGSAIRTGFRYAGNNLELRATFVRAVAFFFFASAYWALLPLIVRSRIGGGPEIYGILLGAIGVGAIGGAFLIPSWRAKLGPDRLVAGASVVTAIAMVLFGLARDPIVALAASLLAGISWIAAVATLSVSAQVALPDWVRGRGLAMYITIFFGALTVGSALWGEVATLTSLPIAHFAAAAGALCAVPLSRRWKLQTGKTLDLMPSMQWPVPVVSRAIDGSDGPVLVTTEYRVDRPNDHAAFLSVMDEIRRERLRDGAYAWGIFEDTAEAGRFLETFYVESWDEHLRQHERVTNADVVLQRDVRGFLTADPTVTHYVTPG